MDETRPNLEVLNVARKGRLGLGWSMVAVRVIGVEASCGNCYQVIAHFVRTMSSVLAS